MPKCRGSHTKVSQVCKKRRTCDGFLLLRPICVAGDAKNTDLRRYGSPPATIMPGTRDGTSHHLRLWRHHRGFRAMTYTFWALFVHFIAHLVNDSHVFGRFCAFRCPNKRRGSVGVKTCSRPRVWSMLPAAGWGYGFAARGSGMCYPLAGSYRWELSN